MFKVWRKRISIDPNKDRMKKSLTKISDFFFIVIYTKNGLEGCKGVKPLCLSGLKHHTPGCEGVVRV